MKALSTKRRWTAAVVGVGVVAGTLFANMPKQSVASEGRAVVVVDSSPSVLGSGQQPVQAPVRLPQSVARSEVVADPFGPLNTAAAPATVPVGARAEAAPPPEKKKVAAVAAPVVEPAPPPPPSAPPLPFTYVGALSGKDVAEGRPAVFLRQNDEVLVVRTGEEIGRTYRVESVAPDRIEFTYLPLKQRQVLVAQ